jgi:lysophospholipase L1-like esterase
VLVSQLLWNIYIRDESRDKWCKVVIFLSVAANLAALAVLIHVIRGRGGIAYLRAWLGHDATANVDPSFAVRQTMFDSLPQAMPVRPIVFLGDSLTASCEWRELFGSRALILNRGIGGDTSAGVLRRIDSVATLKPLAVFLMIGANDLQSLGYSPEQTSTNWRSIIEAILQKSPDTIIYAQSILPSVALKFNEWSARVNEQLRSFARPDSVVYLDMRPLFLDGEVLGSKYTSDGLHLNGTGYAAWKEQINLIMTELIARQASS